MYEQVDPNQDLGSYHAKLLETLFRDMAFGVRETLHKPDATSVHNLRRICLRLRHALRLFGKLLPRRARRKVQRRLGALQDLLAAARSCDVAQEMLKAEPIAPAVRSSEAKKIVAALGQERRRTLRPLRARLRKIQRSGALQRWRTRLVPPG